MKKIFTTFIALSISTQFFAQVISQNSNYTTVSPTGSVACSNSNQTTGQTYYSADNSYTRAFKLSDYAINYDYKITNVAFGVQTVNMPMDVTVRVHALTGTYPSGTLAQLASTQVSITQADAAKIVNTGTSLNQVIPAGSSFVLEVFHDGTDSYLGDGVPGEIFYMGTNSGAQTGPSYLKSLTCGVTAPSPTGSGPLANFASAKWLMTITGENALGVTEVINAKELQIYPNPVVDNLNFKFANGLKAESVELYDLSGRKVNLVNAKAKESINISNFAKGQYILKVKASDGKVYIQKVLKQ